MPGFTSIYLFPASDLSVGTFREYFAIPEGETIIPIIVWGHIKPNVIDKFVTMNSFNLQTGKTDIPAEEKLVIEYWAVPPSYQVVEERMNPEGEDNEVRNRT